jgi:AraC-like DNA-binding protein
MAYPLRIHLLAAAEVAMTSWRHEAVARPYWRMYHNTTSSWSVTWREGSVELGPDRLVVVAPDTIYETQARGPSRHTYIHATVDGLGTVPQVGIWSLPMDEHLRQARAHLLAGDVMRWELAAQALVLASLLRLPAAALTQPNHGPAIAAVVRFLEATDLAVTVERLASIAGMHPTAFIRRFRQETGTTPHRWQQARRIAAACVDLERADNSIEEIAERHGFCDRHHFTRTFTRERGIAPAAYRRQAQR